MIVYVIAELMLGMVFGMTVATGTLALVAGSGVIPRISEKLQINEEVILFENCVIFGGISGMVLGIFPECPMFLGKFPGSCLEICFGCFSGMFVGCLSAALGEVLNVFPVIFHRIGIVKGWNFLMGAYALGKFAGSVSCFWIDK